MGSRIILYMAKVPNERGIVLSQFADRSSDAQEWVDQGHKVYSRSFWYYMNRRGGRYVPARLSTWKLWKDGSADG